MPDVTTLRSGLGLIMVSIRSQIELGLNLPDLDFLDEC